MKRKQVIFEVRKFRRLPEIEIYSYSDPPSLAYTDSDSKSCHVPSYHELPNRASGK